jgi:Uma2 family endonuclease
MGSVPLIADRIRRWTRVEYERLIDLGVFEPCERLELLDGQLVVREPQSSRHAAAIRRVLAVLRRALGPGWQVDSQLPIALDELSLPEPDVAVVPWEPGAYRQAHPSRAVLIVEVADSSYRVDREVKASLYARASVPEYWIVDVARETLEVHREPEATAAGWRYASVTTVRPPATVAPLVSPDRATPVADLLP